MYENILSVFSFIYKFFKTIQYKLMERKETMKRHHNAVLVARVKNGEVIVFEE